GRPPGDGVQEERSVASLPGTLELGDRRPEVTEIDDCDAVQPIGMISELLGEEVVAARGARSARRAEEVEQLPIAARVHETTLDADSIHPVDPFRSSRIVLRVQNDRAAAGFGELDEAREQGAPVGS